MPKTARQLSVAELERMLNSRRTELESLIKQRDKLKKDLADIEKRIAVLQGQRTSPPPAPRPQPRTRPKNIKPLHQYVTDILSQTKKGLPLGELARQVLDAGYKTHSKNFKNTLYQCLYNSKSINHDAKTGRYQLKSTAGPSGTKQRSKKNKTTDQPQTPDQPRNPKQIQVRE